MAGPPPAAEVLRKAMAWQREIQSGEMTQARIARRERIMRALVTRVMALLDMPEDVRERLLAEGEDLRGTLSAIREALRTARAVVGYPPARRHPRGLFATATIVRSMLRRPLEEPR